MMIAKSTSGLEQLPEEIRECRAQDVGIERFAECLCVGPNSCKYALPFGYAFLCQHPRMDEILENTRKTMQATTSP